MCWTLVAWWLALAVATTVAAQDQAQEVEIIKHINRVNEDGSYTFGYEAADGSFKIETRDVTGNVKGMFGFVDENGELKRVSYTANNGTGFQASAEQQSIRREVTRAPVIQHIPRRQATTPVYGSRTAPTHSHQVTEAPEPDEPTQIPLRRLLVTKRPTGKGGNNLRRQLLHEPESGGDAADVYSGAGGSPRYVPAQSVRSAQTPLLANLPPHVAAAIRQQQIARAASALRADPYSRTTNIDEQEYSLPPARYSRPLDVGPNLINFPMASLRSLRDELMDYILQYLQYRLGGGIPYPPNPYSSPFQSPIAPFNYQYQNPVNYPGIGPNPYNPYLPPVPPFARNPYQPPYSPPGYPQGPYNGFPGNYPQSLPFSSPNKQQAGQVQGQEQSGPAPTYSPPPGDVFRMVLSRGLAAASTTTAAPVRSLQILGAASSLSAASVRAPPTPTLAPHDEMKMEA